VNIHSVSDKNSSRSFTSQIHVQIDAALIKILYEGTWKGMKDRSIGKVYNGFICGGNTHPDYTLLFEHTLISYIIKHGYTSEFIFVYGNIKVQMFY